MKVVKPLRLSALHRPFSWQGQNHLGVSVLALADMGLPAPAPRTGAVAAGCRRAHVERRRARLAIESLCGVSRHRQRLHPPSARQNRLRREDPAGFAGENAGGFRRSPLDQRSSFHSLPFAEMRLDWRRAYGGTQFADNPHGIGATPETFPQGRIHRLPNIEPLQERLTSPRHSAQPASFDALDITGRVASPASVKTTTPTG